MTNNQIHKPFDLEERTFIFAQRCRNFCLSLPKNTANYEYQSQLIRSSGSVSANYIEANEAISKKDFFHRLKICRKEAKESRLWLRLCLPSDQVLLIKEQQALIQEALELIRIFTSIITKQSAPNHL